MQHRSIFKTVDCCCCGSTRICFCIEFDSVTINTITDDGPSVKEICINNIHTNDLINFTAKLISLMVQKSWLLHGTFNRCIMSISLTYWTDSSFVSLMACFKLFLNELKPWVNDEDWLLIVAQFFINRFPSKQLLFSSISNSTAAFTLFSCSPSSSSWRFVWHRSRRVTRKCQPEAERTVHPRPCFCPGQCGGNCGSLAQAQCHKSNTRNWEMKIRLLETDDSISMKLCEWIITKIFCLLAAAECKVQSCL